MFLAYSEDDEDGGLLRSGRRFWLGKRRRIATWRERERDVVKLEEGMASWFHRSTKNFLLKRRNIDLFLEMKKKCEFHTRAKTTTY